VGLSKKTKKEVSYMAKERWCPFTGLMSLRQAMDKLRVRLSKKFKRR
jgi:hypothetical protein